MILPMTTLESRRIARRARCRVRQGVTALNEEHGPGWLVKVDLDQLDIASESRCVLGQVYGSYGRGAKRMGLTDRGCGELGFQDDDGVPYSALIVAWQREIVRLRRAERLVLVA